MAKTKTAAVENTKSDDVDLDIVASTVDTGTSDVVVEPTGPTPEEIAADLKKQLEEANARAAENARKAEEAEARAATASTNAGTAIQSQIASTEAAIEGKITTAKTSLDSIKQQLKQAKLAGDTDAEVELQDALNNARYDLKVAEWEKTNFANWKEQQAKVQPKVETGTKSPYTAKEQEWINKHPEFGTNKKFARLAKTAAQEALDEGHTQDSRGYFDYIEGILKEEGFIGNEGEPLSGAGKQMATASTAAAPNRSGGTATVVNKNSKYPYIPNGFRIPADWVDTAQTLGYDDPREYANERLEIEAQDKNR